MDTYRSGQSLIEILIAVSVGVVIIIGAIGIISPILKTSTSSKHAQVAGGLGKELADNLRVFAESDWHEIDSLATSSSNRYHLMSTSSPFTTVSGTEEVVIATTTYTRSFFIDDAYRNSGGKIDGSGTEYDPSTKKFTVEYTWPQGGSASISGYLTRSRNEVFIQTDWSGGGGTEGFYTATSVQPTFSTSSGIDFSGTPGSVLIEGF